MSGERIRGRNGAEKRYKGPRELVGTRVPPQVTDRVDGARADLGLSRNDWLFAAILVAFDNPDLIRDAAASLDDLLPGQRTQQQSDQLRLADPETDLEVLAKPA